MQKDFDFKKCTITITFGDVAENHVGMQKIGEKAKEGFTIEEMKTFTRKLKKTGLEVDFYNIPCDVDHDEAAIIVVRNGLSLFVRDTYELFEEERDREWDTKAFMRGQVKNKLARYNLCYSDFSQEPNFQEGKGRVIDFADAKDICSIRSGLSLYLGSKTKLLNAEGNKYYNSDKCGIGFHGDAERTIVVAFRLGESMPLRYVWFLRNQPISDPIDIHLRHGDMYVMSSKAVGTDWRKSSIPTLRHAAGCEKYTSLKIFEKRAEKKKAAEDHGKSVEEKIKNENNTNARKSNLTVKELKAIAKENGITGHSQVNKGELVGILESYSVL